MSRSSDSEQRSLDLFFSDQRSVGSSPGHGTCVLEKDTLPASRKRTQNPNGGRARINPGFSGSHSKHPCLQVASGLPAWFHLIPEINNNNML